MENIEPSPEVLRQAILELQEPVIFQNIINNDLERNNWSRLSLEGLRDVLGDKSLPFRTGKNSRTKEPQWDLNCPTEALSIDEFLEKADKNHNWYYFDYKYMHQWFRDKPEVLSAVDWRSFGFEKTGEDSTLWIGSKGAHTNCHQDSYGSNLIAQTHGRKQWLLFPPDSGKILQETRVPYEESTIYSRLNFFCPSTYEEDCLLKIERGPMRVVLTPGDVLFVPRGWWHFVESLEVSVSVNVWLPLASDCQNRLREALVKLIIERIGKGLPAVREDVPYRLEEILELIEKCISDCEKLREEPPEEMIHKKIRKTPWTPQDLSREFKNFVKLGNYLTREELRLFLHQQRHRFPVCENEKIQESTVEYLNRDENILKKITDTLCHSEIITRVVDTLLKKD